jgi:hypothetical protein
MKRLVFWAVLALAFVLIAGGAAVYAQGTFKVPFEFKAAGKKLPAGEYWVGQKGDKEIALRKLPDGAEVLVPFTQRLEPPKPPVTEPELVFHAVGNFEPSYTEYVTEYVLAEFWLPGADGFLVHTTKGAHQRKEIKGQPAQ